jgi:hypothetical protein
MMDVMELASSNSTISFFVPLALRLSTMMVVSMWNARQSCRQADVYGWPESLQDKARRKK